MRVGIQLLISIHSKSALTNDTQQEMFLVVFLFACIQAFTITYYF